MGVKPCYVKDCNEIMCSAYHPDIGYLCGDCIEAIKELHGTSKVSVNKIKKFIDEGNQNKILDLDEI